MTRHRNDPAAVTSPVTRRVTVVSLRGQRGVVAVETIEEGDGILPVNGRLTDVPSRYSIQIGEHEHIDLPHDVDPVRSPGEFPWQYLNHSCEANAMLQGRQFIALRRIRPAEEVTFNYNASEYDMASPFECRCGMPSCGGQRIAGFRHLRADQKQALLPYLSEALRAYVARQPVRAASGTRSGARGSISSGESGSGLSGSGGSGARKQGVRGRAIREHGTREPVVRDQVVRDPVAVPVPARTRVARRR